MSLSRRKVVIVGAGHVGSHAGYALASEGLAEEIVLIDVDEKKATAQALDLFDATVYLRKRTSIKAGSYADARDADLMIIAAGPLPDMSAGETRMDTLRKTVAIVKEIVEHIRASEFSGIILSISNPADVVAHYIQHSLDYPPHKVLSTSTTLDSARLRRVLAQAVGLDQKSINAYALGEHGESQMVAWSAVTIGGKPLDELRKAHPETYGAIDLAAIATEAKASGWQILGGKGSTEFGIGAAIAEVVRAIFGDEHRILPVSTLLNGQYGVRGVYASVPAVLNHLGVADVIELNLTQTERAQFHASCQTMNEHFQLALSL